MIFGLAHSSPSATDNPYSGDLLGKTIYVQSAGDFTFHAISGSVTREGIEIALRPYERALLRQLIDRSGKVVCNDRLRGIVQCFEEEPTLKGLRICIGSLAKKLGPKAPVISEVRGVGYRIASWGP